MTDNTPSEPLDPKDAELFAAALFDVLGKFWRTHPEPLGAFRLTLRGDACFVFRMDGKGVPLLEWIPDDHGSADASPEPPTGQYL